MSPILFRFTAVRQSSSKCIARIERVSQVHLISYVDVDNLTALDPVLDKIQEAGVYLIYHMRESVPNIKMTFNWHSVLRRETLTGI